MFISSGPPIHSIFPPSSLSAHQCFLFGSFDLILRFLGGSLRSGMFGSWRFVPGGFCCWMGFLAFSSLSILAYFLEGNTSDLWVSFGSDWFYVIVGSIISDRCLFVPFIDLLCFNFFASVNFWWFFGCALFCWSGLASSTVRSFLFLPDFMAILVWIWDFWFVFAWNSAVFRLFRRCFHFVASAGQFGSAFNSMCRRVWICRSVCAAGEFRAGVAVASAGVSAVSWRVPHGCSFLLTIFGMLLVLRDCLAVQHVPVFCFLTSGCEDYFN